MSDSPVIVISEQGRTPLHVVLVGPLEIGRDATGVILSDPAVSRRHVEIRPDTQGVVVADLGSANGTFVDGVALDGEMRFEPGMIVRLGDTSIELRGSVPSAATVANDVDERLTTISRLAADVAEVPVAPPNAALADGTITIAFTDIESSTELAHGYGDERWFEVLSSHAAVVRAQLRSHGGTEIKNQGDGFMLAFESAHRAVLCLMGIQRAVTEQGHADPDLAVTIRAGAHTGEAIVDDDGDLFGHHVNMAARIADQADGGEIVVSSLVREIVESRGDLEFGETRTVTLKGLAGTYLIHPVVWQA